MTISFKQEYNVIAGSVDIGLAIYDSPPPSGTSFAITGGKDQHLFSIDASTDGIGL